MAPDAEAVVQRCMPCGQRRPGSPRLPGSGRRSPHSHLLPWPAGRPTPEAGCGLANCTQNQPLETKHSFSWLIWLSAGAAPAPLRGTQRICAILGARVSRRQGCPGRWLHVVCSGTRNSSATRLRRSTAGVAGLPAYSHAGPRRASSTQVLPTAPSAIRPAPPTPAWLAPPAAAASTGPAAWVGVAEVGEVTINAPAMRQTDRYPRT
jgi:hypothetical protein